MKTINLAFSLLIILTISFHGNSQNPYPTNSYNLTYVNDVHSLPPPFAEKYRPIKVIHLSKKISNKDFDTNWIYTFEYEASLIKSMRTFNHSGDSMLARVDFSYDSERRVVSVWQHLGFLLNDIIEITDSFFYDAKGNPVKHQMRSIEQGKFSNSQLDTITYVYDQFNRPITCYTKVPHERYCKFIYTYPDNNKIQPNSITNEGVFRYYNIIWNGNNTTDIMHSNPYSHQLNTFLSVSIDNAIIDKNNNEAWHRSLEINNTYSPSEIIVSTKHFDDSSYSFDTLRYTKYGDIMYKSELPLKIEYYFNGKLSSYLSTKINSWGSCDGLINIPWDTICTLFSYFYDSADMKIKALDILPITDISKTKVYPNPTKGYLRFSDINMNDNVNFELYDLLGSMITKGIIAGNGVIDLSGNKNGVFILKISLGNEKKYYKIIIDK